jgi:3-carboxy-cis,cis-muconate cycloisomerase
VLYRTPEMENIFSRVAHLNAGIQFESALARAEATAGVIPSEAAIRISSACDSFQPNVEQIFTDAIPAGTIAIPLVKALTAHVGSVAGGYVHWGATSQDLVDTALMLQMRSGLELIDSRLRAVALTCRDLALEHRSTLMIGRTLTQHALPITFGLKAARWLGLLSRQLERLQEIRGRLLVVQFGGAAGTLASLGSSGVIVQRHLAEELGLGQPASPWHTERDRIVEIALHITVIAGCVSKIASDLAIMAQTDVGEISEGAAEGKGGSSAMPHKQNPVDITLALAASGLSTGLSSTIVGSLRQDNERSAGVWHGEWESVPNVFMYTDFALERLGAALRSLEVHPERMSENLSRTNGLIMAEALTMKLAEHTGRTDAYRIVQAACEHCMSQNRSLFDVATHDPDIQNSLSAEEISTALDPMNYLGSTEEFIDRSVSTFDQLPQR